MCYFCQQNKKEINFKNTEMLRGFISGAAKIRPRKKTGLCSYHQRKLAKAIKLAKYMSLLPYVTK